MLFLEEGDLAERLSFCQFMLNTGAEKKFHFENILWTDELKFDRDVITNFYNMHSARRGRKSEKMLNKLLHNTDFL